jgi:hypothetical protein
VGALLPSVWACAAPKLIATPPITAATQINRIGRRVRRSRDCTGADFSSDIYRSLIVDGSIWRSRRVGVGAEAPTFGIVAAQAPNRLS